MKRVFLILLAILLLAACIPAHAAGSARLQLSADLSDGCGGDTITLSLNLSCENLGGMQTEIRWNEGYLTYVPGSAAFDEDFARAAALSMVNDASSGCIRLVYGNTNGCTVQDEAVFTAQFLLSEGVSGYTYFNLENTKLTDASANLTAMDFAAEGASVYTRIFEAGDAYLSLNGDTWQAYIGDTVTVCMDVSSSGPAVGSLQGTWQYDTAIFEYVPDSAAFSQEAAAAAFTQIINADTPGELKFVYGSLSGCPQGALITAQFRILNDRDTYNYVRLRDAKATNAETGRLALMNCYASDACFEILKRPEVLYYTAGIPETNVYSGDTVTLHLTAGGVTLGGLQAGISYNPDQLEYVPGSAAFSDGFARGASISMINDAAPGLIRLIYSNTGGYTPDGSDIFTARFVVRSCDVNLDPIVLTEFKTTNASADNLTTLQSEFLQGINWSAIHAGHKRTADAYRAPTCTETGLTAGEHCSACDEVLTAQTVIPALGHTKVVDAYQAPTCTETGLTAGEHCSACSEVLTAQTVIPALGHTKVVDAYQAPTCTETGLTEGGHCSVCDAVLTAQTVIPALGHAVAFAQEVYETAVGEAAFAISARITCGHSAELQFIVPGELQLLESSGLSGSFAGVGCGAAVVTLETADGLPSRGSCKVIVHASEKLVPPASLTRIEAEAFAGMAACEVVLSDALKSIGERAFTNCSNLRLINLPDGVELAKDVFSGCGGLTILCSAGGSAQAYAEANEIPCIIR